jgi:hypothetical protein
MISKPKYAIQVFKARVSDLPRMTELANKNTEFFESYVVDVLLLNNLFCLVFIQSTWDYPYQTQKWEKFIVEEK